MSQVFQRIVEVLKITACIAKCFGKATQQEEQRQRQPPPPQLADNESPPYAQHHEGATLHKARAQDAGQKHDAKSEAQAPPYQGRESAQKDFAPSSEVKSSKAQPDQAQNEIKSSKAQNSSKPPGPNYRFSNRNKQAPLMAEQAGGQTLAIDLVNRTGSSNVFVYIIGLAMDKNNAWFLLQSDGKTPYYPESPSAENSEIAQDIGIPLGAPGSKKSVTIPRLAGGRIFVSIDQPLKFLLNPGPALAEPSVHNDADPNINTNWAFMEFTFNGALYGNISYVDFAAIPISLSLQNNEGKEQSVPGMGKDGLDNICSQLKAQSAADGNQGWGQLVVTRDGKNLRALAPGGLPEAFADYYDSYVNAVWDKYKSGTELTIESGDASLKASATIGENNKLSIDGQDFDRPTTADIFSSNSGPFTTGQNTRRNMLIPQLAAAFNRSTLLASDETPTDASMFYKDKITNHYARIVHSVQKDGRGYAFPYDDVNDANNKDQSGFVNDPNPKLMTVTFGGE